MGNTLSRRSFLVDIAKIGADALVIGALVFGCSKLSNILGSEEEIKGSAKYPHGLPLTIIPELPYLVSHRLADEERWTREKGFWTYYLSFTGNMHTNILRDWEKVKNWPRPLEKAEMRVENNLETSNDLKITAYEHKVNETGNGILHFWEQYYSDVIKRGETKKFGVEQLDYILIEYLSGKYAGDNFISFIKK